MLGRYERGKWWEGTIAALLRSWGYGARLAPTHAPYDIVVDDVLFIEVKSGIAKSRALSSARSVELGENKMAVAVWGPLSIRGLRNRSLILTRLGTYPLTSKGFRDALESMGLPSDPEALSRQRQILLSSLSLHATNEVQNFEVARENYFDMTGEKGSKQRARAMTRNGGDREVIQNFFERVR